MTADREPSTADRPGAMACSVAPDGDQMCITCSDEALPAEVVRIDQQSGVALVAIAGRTEEVDISLVDAVAPGDSLLVHGGVAIARLDER